jgi:hypothetical protein
MLMDRLKLKKKRGKNPSRIHRKKIRRGGGGQKKT